MADMNKRAGLGRGLSALIPTPEEDGVVLRELPLSAVTPNPRQPRGVFDEEELEGLAASIRDVGLLQPIVVRPLGGDQFELVAGERRLRASRIAGLTKVPALVRDTGDDDLLKEALIENIHRVQLNPLEEGAAYQQLLEDFDATHEELAARLGKSRPTISNAIRLLTLPPSIQRKVAAGVLSAGHAKAVLALDDRAAQEQLADRIVARASRSGPPRRPCDCATWTWNRRPRRLRRPVVVPRPGRRRGGGSPHRGCSTSRTTSRTLSGRGSESRWAPARAR